MSVIQSFKTYKMIKNIFNLGLVLFSSFVFAQVAIGKSSVSNNSVSLEFGDYVANQGKGIIVPWVTSATTMTTAVPGTIVYDTSDKILKYKKPNNVWFNLSKNETATIGQQSVNTTGVVNTSLQDNYNGNPINDQTNAKTSIGRESTTPGILVLEDNDKAMILPKVPSPHLNIKNPEPGLMVFDTTTKQLAVFNGKVWSFWKP